MDRKIVIGSIVITALVVSYIAISGNIISPCGNEIFQQLDSPDKKHKAIVFQRDCGATTGFSTQITVLKEKQKFGDEEGNVLIAKGHPKTSGFAIRWLSASTLQIENTKDAHTFKNQSKIGSVDISYE